jgi:DNA-binding response OmpR family regulator
MWEIPAERVLEVPRAEKRILVVEDDLHSREGLRDSLRAEGFKVEAAADSWEAILKMKQRCFDIAIIDIDLPPVHGVNLTGWDVARILRAFNSSISLIVVSAHAADIDRAEAGQIRVAQFLEKPISPARLKSIVRTLDHQ